MATDYPVRIEDAEFRRGVLSNAWESDSYLQASFRSHHPLCKGFKSLGCVLLMNCAFA
jgi:hypothetical protein